MWCVCRQGRDKRCRVRGVIVVKLLGTGWTVYDKCTILLDNRCHVADLLPPTIFVNSTITYTLHCQY